MAADWLKQTPEYQNETNPTSFLGTNPPAEKPKSRFGFIRDGEFTSAEQEMTGDMIGGAAQIGASVIEGVATSKAMDSAREEGRAAAFEQRDMQLSSAEMQNKMRAEQQRQEAEDMALNQLSYKNKRKFDMFLYEFKKNLEQADTKKQLASNVINGAKEDKAKLQALMSLWGV